MKGVTHSEEPTAVDQLFSSPELYRVFYCLFQLIVLALLYVCLTALIGVVFSHKAVKTHCKLPATAMATVAHIAENEFLLAFKEKGDQHPDHYVSLSPG